MIADKTGGLECLEENSGYLVSLALNLKKRKIKRNCEQMFPTLGGRKIFCCVLGKY